MSVKDITLILKTCNKTKCVLFRLKQSLLLPSYTINSIVLDRPEFVKDLGVYLTPKLDFSFHCNHIANNAFRRSYLIFASFVSRDSNFLLKMYTTFIRPLLEYGSQVWSPYLKKNIEKIESVQHYFTRCIPGFRTLTYDEWLSLLNLPSLQARRLRADRLFLHKSTHFLPIVHL